MTRPWKTLATAQIKEGTMILLKRGEGDFLIRMDNYVLMNSKLNLTELALARHACVRISCEGPPRILIGGLGMGCTLRAALDQVQAESRIFVAELNPVIVEWCKGPLAELTGSAVDDPRVELEINDVAEVIRKAASSDRKFDAIVLDLYQGTHDANKDRNHPFYGYGALRTAKGALSSRGVFAAWTEDRDIEFEKRLGKAGFEVERFKPGKGGPRHVVYIGVKRHSS